MDVTSLHDLLTCWCRLQDTTNLTEERDVKKQSIPLKKSMEITYKQYTTSKSGFTPCSLSIRWESEQFFFYGHHLNQWSCRSPKMVYHQELYVMYNSMWHANGMCSTWALIMQSHDWGEQRKSLSFSLESQERPEENRSLTPYVPGSQQVTVVKIVARHET